MAAALDDLPFDFTGCNAGYSIFPINLQVNGKMRGTVEIPKDATQDAALAAALHELDNVRSQTEGKDLKKLIFVPGKILNLIVGK